VKTVEVMRLFGPMMLGVALAIGFTVFMVTNLKDSQKEMEDGIVAVDTMTTKFADLDAETKIRVAEWLFTQDVGGLVKFSKATSDMVKALWMIVVVLVSAAVVQFVSLLSYYSLNKEYKESINRNGLRLSVTLIVIMLLYGTYLIVESRSWINDPETFWLFTVLVCLNAVILWQVIKLSKVAVWILLVLSVLSFGVSLYEADYIKQIFQSIQLYLVLEATMSVYGLRAEKYSGKI
jgi:heme/copper-type cytochrome/quinol oxidase subunit 4